MTIKFPRTSTDIDYFALRVRLDESTGCWNWIGSVSRKGYGKAVLKLGNRYVDAHTMAYIMFVGRVPDGKELHHKCKNRRCACPWHLEPKTHQEHCALDFAKTHCPNGHEFVDGSYYLMKSGSGTFSKACKQCAKSRAHARYHADPKARNAENMARYYANREAILARQRAHRHGLKAAQAAM